jgi:hypothetical protein
MPLELSLSFRKSHVTGQFCDISRASEGKIGSDLGVSLMQQSKYCSGIIQKSAESLLVWEYKI